MTNSSARRAVITGAASGLGAAVASRLQRQGWQVVTVDLNDEAGAGHLLADVSDPQQVAAAFAAAADRLGGIDAVAHCAGVFRNTLSPVHTLSAEAWRRTVEVNLFGSFHVTQEALPHLMESRGALVLVASTAAEHPQPGGAAYSASKAGVRALARSVALEYASRGVRACSVSPGYMRTAMTEAVLARDDIRAQIEAGIPAGRTADPDEVAAIVAFLMSSESSFLTGQDVTVDGGGALTAYVGDADVAGMWSRHERRCS